jgi:hypothetical protein
MTTDEMPPLSDRATIAEAAALLDLHPNSVRTRVKAGQYPSEKVLTKKGEAYLIPRAAIDAELRGEPLPLAGTYTPGASAEAGVWIVAPAGTPRQTTGDTPIIDQDGQDIIAASTPPAVYEALVLSLRQALDPTIAELARAADALHDAAQEIAVTRATLDRAREDLDAERTRRIAAERRVASDVADPWHQVLRDLGNATSRLTGTLTPRRPSPR